MKANFSPICGLTFEVSAESAVDMFGQLSELQEVFGDLYCQHKDCKSERPARFIKRTVDGNDYYELQCPDCFAKLSMGLMKKEKGKMYTKTTWNSLSPSEQKQWPSKYEGKYLPNGGWYKWKELKAEKEQEENSSTKGKRGRPPKSVEPVDSPVDEVIPF